MVTLRTGTRRAARWFSLGVLCAGVLMVVLDQTIVNVALPAIQADLGFSQTGLAWIVNAYLIAFGGVLLLAGRMGDLLGRRTVFLAGLGVFTFASAACGLSGSQAMLVAARFIQGLGGAAATAVVLAMIVTMFESADEQARAIGVYSFVASAGASIGLLLGGLLIQALNWHWIFFVNVPIGAAVAVLTLRLLPPDSGSGQRESADAFGALLVTSSLMLGVYTIVQAPQISGARTAGLATLSVVLLVGFLGRQHFAANPLMPLTIFRLRTLTAANAVQALTVAGMISMFFISSLYLERVLQLSPLALGLSFLPSSLSISVLSLSVAPRLNVRFGPRKVLLAGLAIAFAGLVVIARAPVGGTYARDILPAMLLIGVGIGVMFPGLMTLAMAGVEPADTGLASGLINTTGQVGGALGLAVLATLASGRTQALQANGESLPSALTAGFDMAFAMSAVLFVVAIVITMVTLNENHLAEPVKAGGAQTASDAA